MCCKNPCSVARCNGCPRTDWNSFSWRMDSPASLTSFLWGSLERRFYAFSEVMRYPGVCPCVWVQYLGEEGRDTSGVYNPETAWHNIASSWVLSRQLVGDVWTWKLFCYRYAWDWTYYETLYGAGPYNSWFWGADGPGVYNNCGDGTTGDLAYGYPGYGYGWGGYGYGYGFDPAFWSIGGGMATEYNLEGTFDCAGTNRFVRDDSQFVEDELYIADSWPAYVDLTRVALMLRVPTT